MKAETGDVKRPVVVTVVAGAIAIVAMVVVAVPWLKFEETDVRYGAIFALFGIALMVLATGLLQWEWLWEALRGALFVGAGWALIGDAVGYPLGPVHSPEKIGLALVVLGLVVALGQTSVSEYYAAQVERSARGREISFWSEGEALMVAGFFLGTAVLIGKLATSFSCVAPTVNYSLAMPALAALGLWLVGSARVAYSKGYPEWMGVVLALTGPVAYFILAVMPLRSERVQT